MVNYKYIIIFCIIMWILCPRYIWLFIILNSLSFGYFNLGYFFFDFLVRHDSLCQIHLMYNMLYKCIQYNNMYYVWCFCVHLTFLLKNRCCALMFKVLYTFRPISVVINIVYIIYIICSTCMYNGPTMTFTFCVHFSQLDAFPACHDHYMPQQYIIFIFIYISNGLPCISSTVCSPKPSFLPDVCRFAPRKSFLHIIICLPRRLFVRLFPLFTVTAVNRVIDHTRSQLEINLF